MANVGNSINNNAPPIGCLQYFSIGGSDTTYPNQNWLACDGSIVSQASYPTLYSRLGLLNPGASIWISTTSNSLMTGVYTSAIFATNFYFATNGGVQPSIFTSTDAVTLSGAYSGSTTGIFCLSYGNGIYVYGGSAGNLGTSTDGITWQVKNPTLGAPSTTAGGPMLIFANSLFVGGGNANSLYTSTDGINFTARKSTFTNFSINCFTYGSVYVLGLSNGRLNTSTDGITWTAQTSGVASNINSLAYGNSAYVFSTNAAGAISSSTDAVTWVSRTSNSSSTIFSLVFGGGIFVYGGAGAALGTSTDGTTWTARTSGAATTISCVMYGGGASNPYVLGCTNGTIRSSTDAITWTARTSNTTSTIFAIGYNGSVFAYGAGGGVISTSTDGITWVARTSNTTSSIYSMTNNGTTFVGGGVGFQISSTDGTTWTVNGSYSGTLSNINTIAFGNNLFTYGGAGGVLATSTDGQTWTSRTSNTTSSINAITYGTDWVFVANGGVVSSSTDAITWTTRVSQTTSNVLCLTYGNSLYVYGTGGGGIGSSTDGTTWVAQTSGTTTSINSIAYSNGTFVAVGGNTTDTSQILTSTDLVTWNQQNLVSGMVGSNAITSALGIFVFTTGTRLAKSSNTYSYNPATQFQLPTYNSTFTSNFTEVTSNFKRTMYIKAV